MYKIITDGAAKIKAFSGEITKKDEVFYNPKMITKRRPDGTTYQKPHWSQGLPRGPGVFQRGVTEAWMKVIDEGLLEGYYLGNAAHFQTWPARHKIPHSAAMEWGVDSMYDLRDDFGDRVRGTGRWSRKHLMGRKVAGKRAVVIGAKRPTVIARRIQELLNEKSYKCPITGVISPETRLQAINYLRDTNFTPDKWESAELSELLSNHTRLTAPSIR